MMTNLNESWTDFAAAAGSLPSAVIPLWKADEVLILDPRGGQTPADMVTQKLEALLWGIPSATTAALTGGTRASGRVRGSLFQPL